MGKIFVYVFVISGVLALLSFAGFGVPSGGLVEALINGGLGNIENTTFWSKIQVALTIIVGVGAIVASFFRSSFDFSLAKATFASWFLSIFAIDLIWIYNTLFDYGAWYAGVASILFVPLVAGFLISALEWVNGND